MQGNVSCNLARDCVNGTVASPSMVPSSPATVPSRLDGTVAARLRYHLDGTVASAYWVLINTPLTAEHMGNTDTCVIFSFMGQIPTKVTQG